MDDTLGDPAYRQLTDQQLAEIDELCDAFDQELVSGGEPRIEAFLAGAPESARDGLLAELLAMEFEYRARKGENPDPQDYIRRFPQQESIVASALFHASATQFPDGDTISDRVEDGCGLENFRLIEEIGRGGMGVVWRAEQLKPVRRQVALKLIRSELTSGEVLARFNAETQALAMMDHPHIARVLDAGSTGDGRPYFAMELVDGVPISQYCDDSRLTVNERLRLVCFVDFCVVELS
jgi:hypothetical protein